MHYVVLRKGLESVQYVSEVEHAGLQRHHLLRRVTILLHELFKGSAVAVLVYEVEVVDRLEHVQVADDVRVVLHGT